MVTITSGGTSSRCVYLPSCLMRCRIQACFAHTGIPPAQRTVIAPETSQAAVASALQEAVAVILPRPYTGWSSLVQSVALRILNTTRLADKAPPFSRHARPELLERRQLLLLHYIPAPVLGAIQEVVGRQVCRKTSEPRAYLSDLAYMRMLVAVSTSRIPRQDPARHGCEAAPAVRSVPRRRPEAEPSHRAGQGRLDKHPAGFPLSLLVQVGIALDRVVASSRRRYPGGPRTRCARLLPIRLRGNRE